VARLVVRLARHALIIGSFIIAAVLGSVSGVLFAFSGDLPRISALDDYEPATITHVYGADNQLIGDFATQRRVIVRYEDIPEHLRLAILAAEDAEFERHFGLSIPRIIVTAIRDIIQFRKAAGASTLTQQLARKLFLTDEKTWERKIKEALLSIQIEKRYTKREIFTLYCNQMYWGHGAYGVEAASQLYFRRSVKQLSLEEAALIAGIIQGNVRQSPYVNMNAALRRRNYALDRMAEVGFIPRERAEAARKTPIVVRGEPGGEPSIAPYFLEEVRKHLESRYGAKQLYEAGLTVHTPLDVRLQQAANAALQRGLRRLDKIQGFRRPERNILAEKQTLESFQHPRWNRGIQIGDVVPALVTGIDRGRLQVRVGRRAGFIDRDGYKWTNRPPERLVRAGDLVEIAVTGIDDKGTGIAGTLEQQPVIQGAVLALDNRTGQIRAMTGGYDFDRSKFNRALQAMRQVGSAFKPIVYAAAIDRGYTPTSLIDDVQRSFPSGPDQPPYEPQNYDRKYEGPVTLRHALEQSRNIPAVAMMEQLGPESVTAYARRLGFDGPLPPYLSVALGSAEATLLTLVRAYSVFANQGVLMEPLSVLKVTDREGNVLEENRPQARDAIRADTAFVMTSLLRGAVLRGTAAKAAALNWPLAGKTGTTDDYTDAWFVGFDPDLTLGVWVGYDQKKPIGPGMTGGDAALPIWIDIMKAWLQDKSDPRDFESPGNIIFMTVDRLTGRPVEDGTPGAIPEAFIAGTQPGVGFPR
jgi:penicillin-binding protein 1A